MTLSQDFILSLDSQRDRLFQRAYAAAAASPTAAGLAPSAITQRAEVLLQSALRETFTAYEKDHALNPATEVENKLPAAQAPAASEPIEDQTSKIENPEVMPADTWARLVATVQVEAARSAHSRAINPDSVLVNPDPLLAPKKATSPDDIEGLDLPPTSRFLLAGSLAILIAIGLTIYLLTRSTHPTPTTRPSSTTTASQPATAR